MQLVCTECHTAQGKFDSEHLVLHNYLINSKYLYSAYPRYLLRGTPRQKRTVLRCFQMVFADSLVKRTCGSKGRLLHVNSPTTGKARRCFSSAFWGNNDFCSEPHLRHGSRAPLSSQSTFFIYLLNINKSTSEARSDFWCYYCNFRLSCLSLCDAIKDCVVLLRVTWGRWSVSSLGTWHETTNRLVSCQLCQASRSGRQCSTHTRHIGEQPFGKDWLITRKS